MSCCTRVCYFKQTFAGYTNCEGLCDQRQQLRPQSASRCTLSPQARKRDLGLCQGDPPLGVNSWRGLFTTGFARGTTWPVSQDTEIGFTPYKFESAAQPKLSQDSYYRKESLISNGNPLFCPHNNTTKESRILSAKASCSCCPATLKDGGGSLSMCKVLFHASKARRHAS